MPAPMVVVLPLTVPGHRVLPSTMMLSFNRNHDTIKMTTDDLDAVDHVGIESSNRPNITYPRAEASL